MILNLQV